MFPCPSCSKWVRVDDNGRMPPWCKACGASFKADAPRPAPIEESYSRTRCEVADTNIQVAGAVPATSPAASSTDIQSAESRRPVAPPRVACSAIREGAPASPSASPRLVAAAEASVDVPDISIGAKLLFWNAQAVSAPNSRAGRYRVYLTRSELFFILMEPEKGSTGALETAGFVVGGIVGGLLTRMALEESAPLRTASIAEVLRGADEDTLRLYAQREPGCFYRHLEHCTHVRIEKPSIWARWINRIEHEAQLMITHNGVQEYWALSNYQDVRKAVNGLAEVLGERLDLGIRWGRSVL